MKGVRGRGGGEDRNERQWTTTEWARPSGYSQACQETGRETNNTWFYGGPSPVCIVDLMLIISHNKYTHILLVELQPT